MLTAAENKILALMVKEYQSKKYLEIFHQCYDIDEMLKYYKQLKPIKKTIEQAGKAAYSEDKKHSHQWCINNNALANLSKKMKGKTDKIKKSNGFDTLFGLLKELDIVGLGQLTIYDTSLRIAFYLDLGQKKMYPKSVYLHRGAAIGAKYLNIKSKKCHNATIAQIDTIPKVLKELEPYQIENFLCIYKDKLKIFYKSQ